MSWISCRFFCFSVPPPGEDLEFKVLQDCAVLHDRRVEIEEDETKTRAPKFKGLVKVV